MKEDQQIYASLLFHQNQQERNDQERWTVLTNADRSVENERIRKKCKCKFKIKRQKKQQ